MAITGALPTTERQIVTVQAQQDETLDHLAWRTTGSETALAELMTLNPHLTSPLLPTGADVLVPVRTAVSTMRETVQLWS